MRQSKRECYAPVEFAELEQRVLFCSYHTAASQNIGTFPAISAQGNVGGNVQHQGTYNAASTGLNVPAMSSLPGALATIYLDFNGDAAGTWGSFNVGATRAYDTDGNANSFSAGELASINDIFQRVAEKFSIFNVNVTTVNPGTFNNGRGLRVVIGGNGSWTGSGPGGISYVGAFTNSAPNTAYAFSENLGNGLPKYVAEAIAHETGHAFGLQHQSVFNGQQSLQEYNPGTSASAPIMGNSYSALRGLWWNGQSSNTQFQDDISVIANSTNGFGYRKDDYGSGRSNARLLRFNNGKFVIKGVINNSTDRDYFRLDWSGGEFQAKIRSASTGAMLDARLTFYRADGTTIVATDGTGLGETLTRTLAPGTYYVLVSSHGSYGDVGQFQLFGYNNSALAAQTRSAPSPAFAPRLSVFSEQPIGGGTVDELVALADA